MRSARLRDALAGALSVAMAIGISELIAGLVGSVPSLVQALGDWVIDNVSAGVKEWAISTFGTNDKTVLVVSIVVVAMIIGAIAGLFARRRFWIAAVLFSGFGLVAGFAALSDTEVSSGGALLGVVVAVVAGLATLRLLLELGGEDEGNDASRRTFILGLGAVAGAAFLTAGFGRLVLAKARQVVAGRDDVVVPVAADRLPPVSAEAELAVEGLSPIIVPNEDFFRIDTALAVPRVQIETWTLAVNGMVANPLILTFEELLAMPMVEHDVTLSCVSNPVGGDLVGNARWQGVVLGDLLDQAGVAGGAEQLVGRSVDGFTVGFPVDAVYDGRTALIAVAMNGEPLPFEHGFPARLVVAGLYGYVSATKWLAELELTTWEGYDAYWVPRGWAKEAPVKTQSRIDTPAAGAEVSAGNVTVAGVAWAPDRGISRVEVRLGEGADWVEADLSKPLSDDAWVQWKVDWNAPSGSHVVTCRATNSDGETQTDTVRPPAPDGATGWHSLTVVVV